MTDSLVPYSLDDYFQSSNLGSIDQAIGNNLFGINHRQIPGVVSSNKDVYGLTFFVRPQLNLQADNVRNFRLLSPLLNEIETSIQRHVRCSLDPRLIHGYTFNNHSIPTLSCPIVDNLNCFIPILTNNLTALSGWPDLAVPTYTSEPGLYREQYSQVDGIARNFEMFDLNVSFRNTKGDPILYMFYVWLHYMAAVFEGKLSPYIDFITEREMDYNTKIYRLVLDQQKNVVTKIGATGVAFPISNAVGSFFDYNVNQPYNDQNKEITIRFRCLGFECLDDILVHDFNKSVVQFNSNMRNGVRENVMYKINKNIVHLFNNRGYPRINPNTYELEWWIDNNLYNSRSSSFIQNAVGDTDTIVQDEEFTGD